MTIASIVSSRASLGLQPGEVVLSFDDGPNPHDTTTTDLLDVLDRWQVRASFCIVGRQAEQSPDTIRRIDDSGHCLVNHSQSHPLPWPMTERHWLDEIDTCDEVLSRILGRPGIAPTFRPPYGLITPPLRRALRKRQRLVAGISYYAFDTYYTPIGYAKVVRKIVRNATLREGGAFIFHDYRHRRRPSKRWNLPNSRANRSWVPAAVDQVIAELSQAGMTFRRDVCCSP